MKTINLSAEFINSNKVEVIKLNDGGLQIVFPGSDFLIFSNNQEVIYSTVFDKGGIDDTLSCKDLLLDQIQYVDYIQRDRKTKLNGIDKKFRKVKT